MNAHAEFDLLPASTDLANLLALLVDPAATKSRLDELIARENAAREQIAIQDAREAETRRLHSQAQAAMIVANNRKIALDAREAELDGKAEKFDSAERLRSDAALQRRELAVAAREESASREANRLAALKADLEGKHASIRGLADTLRP